MKLNQKQLEAFETVVGEKSIVIVITGSAGTGKTTTMAAILEAVSCETTITATTHAAKTELGKRVQGKIVNTTQSAMGFSMVKKGYSMDLVQIHDPVKTDLLIVDETSMLPKKVFNAIQRSLKDGGIKAVVFLGDAVQLPAVSGGFDLNSIKGKHIELTEQMRQDEADITSKAYLDELRLAIDSDSATAPSLKELENITSYKSHVDFCNAYKDCNGDKRIITYRNRVADKYNEYIHTGEERFNKGDLVILDKPLMHAETIIANNGEVVVIDSAEYFQDMLYWKLTVVTYDGSKVRGVLNWDSPAAKEAKLSELKSDGNLNGFWSLSDKSFRLKHMYACTVFKSQGSSIANVFVDAADLWAAHTCKPSKWAHPISFKMFLRLLYVAVSRMEAKAHLFTGLGRDYSNMKRS